VTIMGWRMEMKKYTGDEVDSYEEDYMDEDID
jgi:hypothetical protein